MGHRHIVRKLKAAPIDQGTPERAERQGGLIADDRQYRENGQVYHRPGLRARAECALDAMLLMGALGEGDAAASRHKAGEWLRELHVSTHPTRTAMNWGARGRDHSEMSDRTAWNLKCLSDTMRALGLYRAVTEAVCCDDRMAADTASLCKGLDLLIKLRGIDGLDTTAV